LNIQVSGDYRSAGITLLYQAVGQQWMEDANERIYKGHQLIHLRLRMDHSFREAPLSLTIRGGVKNLFNAAYASMILVNAPSFGGSLPRYYYPGPPRQFFMGITLKFTRT
jgi:iron complex outermembrane receptor protein